MTTHQHPDRLLLVMPDHQLVRKAVAAGLRIWSVWDPQLRDEDFLCEVAAHSEQLLLADFTDGAALRTLLATTAAEHGIARMLHVGGGAAPEVLGEAEVLGQPEHRVRSLRRLNDGAEMRRMLRENGLAIVRAERVRSIGEVRSLLVDFTLPVVIRFTDPLAGRLTAFIGQPSDLDRWAGQADAGISAGPYVVEDFLAGPRFSVETLTVDGMHFVIGITAQHNGGPPDYVELGQLHPAPLSEDDAAAIRVTVTRLLDLADYEFGPAHTEVVLTERGPRITQSQARLGGSWSPMLIEIATGFDLEAGMFRALAGHQVKPPVAYRFASLGFLHQPTGASPARLDEIRALPYVHAVGFSVGQGGPVPPGAVGPVVVVLDAASPAEAAERLTAVRQMLGTEPPVDEPDTGGPGGPTVRRAQG